MKLQDFKIGEEFTTNLGRFRWRCTDIGTRVITAIRVDDAKDKSWYNGPPYAVHESVFDENDQPGCNK